MQSNINLFTPFDTYLVPLYLLIIFIFGYLLANYWRKKHDDYKYFLNGLFFKIVGASLFCIIYLFYYKGGDTLNYFLGAKCVAKLIMQDFDKGFHVLFNTDSIHNSKWSFNYLTGYPPSYMWKDQNTFSVCRFSTIFYILSSGSFFVTSFLTAIFSYVGIWKLFRLLNSVYPGNSKIFAYLILYLPTLLFWGSGIMKDSYVLGSTCWITYNFYKVFIVRKKILINVAFLLLNFTIIVNTKAYVLISLIPGMLLWLNNSYLKNAKGVFSKIFLFPILILSISFIGFFVVKNLSSLMGVYGNVDSAIQQAQIIQGDLLREEAYGSNNYNIGKIDGSLGGMITLAPIAVFTAIYRPLFWEIGSPLMVISVIENSILLLFTIFLVIRISPIKLFKILLQEPLLMYSFVFSLFFAFGVGIAGTNFGALVRYKVPLVPFFFTMIFMIYKLSKAK